MIDFSADIRDLCAIDGTSRTAVGPEMPSGAVVGDLWFDTIGNATYFWNGTNWS